MLEEINRKNAKRFLSPQRKEKDGYTYHIRNRTKQVHQIC